MCEVVGLVGLVFRGLLVPGGASPSRIAPFAAGGGLPGLEHVDDRDDQKRHDLDREQTHECGSGHRRPGRFCLPERKRHGETRQREHTQAAQGDPAAGVDENVAFPLMPAAKEFEFSPRQPSRHSQKKRTKNIGPWQAHDGIVRLDARDCGMIGENNMGAPKDAQELFNERVPRALAKFPEQAREVDAIYCFRISGETGGEWTVDLSSDPPSIEHGDNGSAQCTIEVSAEDFETMLENPQVGMELYFQGKLRISGDPMLASKLEKFFELVGRESAA